MEKYIDNIINLFIVIIIVILAIIIAFVILMVLLSLINRTKKYDIQKIWDKRKFYEKEGVERCFFRYWVWQGNKRKCIIQAILQNTEDKIIYPKARWRQCGKVKMPLRRGMWFLI